jgi:hypothetical protein
MRAAVEWGEEESGLGLERGVDDSYKNFRANLDHPIARSMVPNKRGAGGPR